MSRILPIIGGIALLVILIVLIWDGRVEERIEWRRLDLNEIVRLALALFGAVVLLVTAIFLIWIGINATAWRSFSS